MDHSVVINERINAPKCESIACSAFFKTTVTNIHRDRLTQRAKTATELCHEESYYNHKPQRVYL